MYRASQLSCLILLLTLFFFSFSFLPNPSTADTDSFIYGGCTQLAYTPGSAYETNLNSLLTSLVNSATYSPFNKFTISGSSQQDVVYGLYQCRGDLSMPDCANCIQRAVSQLGILCPSNTGGAVQLQGCFIKYDNVSFLGVEDKTVVMKKCGSTVSYQSDVISQRDAVLNGLTSGSGLYRVGGYGAVQGVGQCVGDLSSGECQDCLTFAVGRLKSECGAAVYGDMFLGKCYVRYSTGGGGGGGSGSGGGGGGQSQASTGSSSEQNDQTSKTLAIIIGMLALVALIVIFVSFISRAIERQKSGGK